jgi:hypothetical protein
MQSGMAKSVSTPAQPTGPDRLSPLLPWINGDPLSSDEVRRLLNRFTSTHAGGDLLGLSAEPGERPPGVPAPSARQITHLRREVLAVLRESAPTGARVWSTTLRRLPSLQFAVTRSVQPGKRSTMSATERRAYVESAYRMTVTGRLRDIVLYTLMRTLTEAGAVALAQCEAPTADDAERPCHRWFIAWGRRGRPGVFCSSACRLRAWKHRHRRPAPPTGKQSWQEQKAIWFQAMRELARKDRQQTTKGRA